MRPGGRLVLSDIMPASAAIARNWIARWLETRIARGYGPSRNVWNDGGYETVAREAGMRILSNRDITRHTLPTYRFFARLPALLESGNEITSIRTATRMLAVLSRLGLVQYRVLCLEKSLTPSSDPESLTPRAHP